MPNGCWEWGGSRFSNGYGRIADKAHGKGKQLLAHRISYELYIGDPGEFLVRHKCDNPPCVNPDHLELGTQKENLEDAWIRRRTSRGESNPQSKITDKAAWEIMTSDLRGSDLARMFGISQAQVSRIKSGQRRSGHHPDDKKPKKARTKITSEQVAEIQNLKGKEKCQVTADRYGISNQQVSRIQNGRRSGSTDR